MDKDRQIRMLIPPFFLIASVLWLAYLTGKLGPYLEPSGKGSIESLKPVLSILGLVGIATLPLGYAIGIFTITVFRLCPKKWPFPHGTYEIPVSAEAMPKLRKLLDAHKEIPAKYDLSTAAVVDHVRLHPKIHEWLLRRLNSFNVSAQSIMALGWSILLARALGIPLCHDPGGQVWKWWALLVLLVIILGWNSVRTWKECEQMFDFAAEFQAARKSEHAKEAKTTAVKEATNGS
jgi:hypothetical protein